jgi:hypothetical protein
MEPHRHLLLEGELKTNVKSNDGKRECDYILVFNDCFAFLSEVKSTKQVEMVLKFEFCWIREGAGGLHLLFNLLFVLIINFSLCCFVHSLTDIHSLL